ncbi:hypothetical protein EKD16_01370 [Streptomonospora litoralis]|uniref:Uncharacterized protein n=2 Tax=Streptomonospora litoralis TaxID=2498135 RepID=A0A4P6PYX8_9ACTN|nr:hypothetical protein EKD16_01370 [Streptomonospora litoralis]
MIAGTWGDADGAAAWMVSQYEKVRSEIDGPDAFWSPAGDRYTAALRDMADGRDLTWQYQLGGDERAFVAVIACSPNTWDAEAPCPLEREER